ncbi:unnamed protein product [Orchesella dallaii]|uniref:Uncharacterized protein n=1 Tax=Orchesella dallaii TaxID=48710 RepID=A0ABP1QB87_9HEXA
MAYIEEKRRQFMYHQGLPKQTIIPKKGKKKTEESKKSTESAEDEEEEKSKEEELSKEDKEEEKSREEQEEVSKEEKESDKSIEEKEEQSAEEESSESSKSNAKLSKYKIKKKLYSQNRKDFKTRMDTDEYDDVDSLNDHIVTVPWDDRKKNDSDPLKPSEIYDKLFGKVLPSFQLPKIAKSIPGMSYFTSAGSEEVTTTTTQRPGLLRRMLMVATGSGPSSTHIKHNNRPVRRYRRDTEEEEEDDDDDDVKLTSKNDEIILKQIRDPARQCRMIFKGCDLPYEHIMKMVSSGQVLIENDQTPQTTTRKPVHDPATSQDDEYEQAMKDRMASKKSPKPIPQLLAQASLGGKKKVKGPIGLPIFGKNKKRPASFESDEVFGGYDFKPKKSVASLPLRPMKYQWGKPTYTVNGEPTYSSGAPDYSGGIFDPNAFKPAQPQPTTTTTTTTERPIFARVPLDPKNNHSAPVTHSVIQVNKTHAVHVLSKKPYNPVRTRTRDAKGNPLSFSTVFTEIAGNSGGIHDFFDRISGAFGGDGQESGREFPAFPDSPPDHRGQLDNAKLPASPHAKPTAFPSAPIPPDEFSKDGDDDDVGSSERNDDDDDSDEDAEDDNNEEEEGDGEEEEEDDDNNEEEEDEPADDVAAPEAVQKQKPVEKPQTYLETNPESYIGVGTVEKKPGSYTVEKKNKNKNKPTETKKPVKDEEEEEDEEAEDDVAEGEENPEGEDEQMDLPDNVPPFIQQSMIEDMKRKKAEQEKEEREGDDAEEDEEGEGQPGPGGGPQQYGGRPGQGQQYGGRPGQGHLPQHQQGGPHQPPQQGGFLSSLFSG